MIVLALRAEHKTLVPIFFMKQYFFLNSNPDLGFDRYLEASDLPNQIVPEGFNCSITKLGLHKAEATIGQTRFLLISFQNKQSALFLKNGTVKVITEPS